MTVHWATEDLPGRACAAAPEPPPGDDTDGPWCRTPGLLPEQRRRVADVYLANQEYL